MPHFLSKLISPRASFPHDMSEAEAALMQQHAAYWMDLMDKGKAVAFGPVADPAGFWGLALVEADSEPEKRALAAADPMTQAGAGFRYEIFAMAAGHHPVISHRRFHALLKERAPLRRNPMATEIRVPTLGESVSEAHHRPLVQEARRGRQADEPVVELETDKVTLEVNASAGTLGDIVAKDGTTVAPGAVLGSIIEGAGGAQAASKSAPAAPAAKPAAAPSGARLRARASCDDPPAAGPWARGGPPRRGERLSPAAVPASAPRRPRHQGRHARAIAGGATATATAPTPRPRSRRERPRLRTTPRAKSACA